MSSIIDLAIQAGLRPKWVASTEGGEYHSSCPVCGGKDRFRLHPLKQKQNCIGTYSCRQCLVHGDAIEFAIQYLHWPKRQAFEQVGNGTPMEKKLFRIPDEFKPQLLIQPSDIWKFRASEFVDDAHTILLHETKRLIYLENRGISFDDVLRYKIGWSHKNHFLSRAHWGLPAELNDKNEPRPLWIPKGIVIPTFADGGMGSPIRIKVRRSEYKEGDKLPKYVATSGSMNGMNIIGNENRPDVIIVESELDAIAIDATLGHSVCAIAVGAALKNPDILTDRIAKNARNLLICHDNDRTGKAMLIKWRKLYPKAVSFPAPKEYKDIGEAIEHGESLIKWFSKVTNSNSLAQKECNGAKK